ncbi:MAG TPA: hypothetical protein VE869_07250 [Gemmatimonas sp.]|nr:hypothetical protein [Gemmatimonas sp.]
MSSVTRWCFRVGAMLAAAVALLHAALPFVAPEWYAFFGASDLAVAKRAGAPWPDALTRALAVVFAGWVYYALAALGVARRPPLLRWGLAAIGGVCLLRGATLVPELLALARGAVPLRYPVFSAVALAIGVTYGVGTWRAWATLGGKPVS